jgi:hypothetical protein
VYVCMYVCTVQRILYSGVAILINSRKKDTTTDALKWTHLSDDKVFIRCKRLFGQWDPIPMSQQHAATQR